MSNADPDAILAAAKALGEGVPVDTWKVRPTSDQDWSICDDYGEIGLWNDERHARLTVAAVNTWLALVEAVIAPDVCANCGHWHVGRLCGWLLQEGGPVCSCESWISRKQAALARVAEALGVQGEEG